jgi:beta-glucosidase
MLMYRGKTARYRRRTGIALSLVLSLASTLAIAQKTTPHGPSVPPSNRQLASPEIERRVNALLAKMTLEEKLGQLVQYNTVGATSATVSAGQEADLASNPEANYHLDPMQLTQMGRLGSMLNVTGGARISSYQHAAVEKSRLHIPLLFGADVIHGYRTIYPVPLGLAASFDPPMVTSLARMAAEEATTAGIRWFYSPMVDISRDARWGRSTEGAGEDAYLGSAMACAYIRGYQNDTLSKPDSVAASVKHFAAYGAAEAGRKYNTTDMSESRLRQVYLPAYKAAIEAGAATVMSSFNSLNGVPGTAFATDLVIEGIQIFLPPRSARWSPHRLSELSLPKRPRMKLAHLVSSRRRYSLPAFVILSCGSRSPDWLRFGRRPR